MNIQPRIFVVGVVGISPRIEDGIAVLPINGYSICPMVRHYHDVLRRQHEWYECHNCKY